MNRLKEITALEARAAGQVRGEELATLCALEDAGRVSQDSVARSIRAQNGRKERAAASTDISQRLPSPEVVCCGDCRRGQSRDRRHRLVEDAFFLGIGAQVLEGAL